MKKKPKQKDIFINYDTPKYIQKAINKQCMGKTGWTISVERPIPRLVKNYYDRLLLDI